jgi:hypothetical protein
MISGFLFDNLDKGWSSHGVDSSDIVMIHTLIEALKKIQRDFQKRQIHFFPLVFLRNDVYQLVVSETADRGKEITVSLDWSNPELLRQMVRKRLIYNDLPSGADFEQLWRRIATSHYRGEESFQFLIERSLMRPRYLLNLVSHCKAMAINFGHDIIEEEDIELGLEPYSNDLVTDTDYEIGDVFPEGEGILYTFLEREAWIKKDELTAILAEYVPDQARIQLLIDQLIWYCLLGVVRGDEEIDYIYDVNYDLKKIRMFEKRGGDNLIYAIHPAFWPALEIVPRGGR